MKLAFKLLSVMLGLFLIYDGYSIYTFTARSPDGSMGIRRLFDNLFIPATDFHLHTYGISFFLVGVLFVLIPVIRIKQNANGEL
ncbi:hypothetical protein D3P08_03360 [Paenibacillus nanensis]|uniref:Uncharacterized protein n=1 Tax=Paenibacillus nanensis TaxID=393251 RepID=A0A3A1VE72_9BACL|nr:hypothetical protein D3P08_03360 [Paenibacillus nanensis]